jgi:adenosine deaminase/adenosine deaminase CECR1
MTGFEISNQSSLVVGIDMVAAEDNHISMKYYETHMQMLNFLSEIYDDVNITLHAGELSIALSNVTASNMTDHIKLAINTGNAQRIGHGVDITYEINSWPDLYQNMSDNMITVEVPLTSNRIILKVEGQDHPIINYTKYGVPVTLATDDPGVLNTNMTNEYSIAASNYTSLNYSDFKKIARNSLEFSFLSGMSLWENPDYSNFVSECKGTEVGFVDINSTCAKFLENNKKANLQWEFETKLKEFEDNLPN